MRELSEQELLLLSNYLYMDCSVNQMTIEETLTSMKNEQGLFDVQKVQQAGVGGGMSVEEAVELFTRMDQMPKQFQNLEVARSIDDGGIRAACFTEMGSADAAVVFRGTGGEYHAWTDNVYGAYMSDTDIQMLAADFINDNCGVYENITVSGHSKGGNLAQYVTVVCKDKVDRCLSFDGQGFGTAFLEENKVEVAAASSKITSISAHNDFVNILLTPIAGKRIFVENEGEGVQAHSSFSLLVCSRFDEQGQIVNVSKQAATMQALERATACLVAQIERLPDNGNILVCNLLASMIAGIMSSDQGESYEQCEMKKASEALYSYAIAAVPFFKLQERSRIMLCTQSTFLSVPNLKGACQGLLKSVEKLEAAKKSLEDLKGQVDYSLAARIYTDVAIGKITERLFECQKKTSCMEQLLEEIIYLYEVKEGQLVEWNNLRTNWK